MAEVLFEIPEWLDYADYDNYPSESKPTTNADFINYSRNQNKLVGALTSAFLWQPNTNFITGKIIITPNMPEGMEAVALTGGFTGTVEPAWESDVAEYQDSGVKWQLRYQHWSKDVEQITDLTTGATNRLPNTTYAVGNVVYNRSNLSVALKCTQTGTTSNTELDISGRAVGDSVEDGSVVWMVIDRDYTKDYEQIKNRVQPIELGGTGVEAEGVADIANALGLAYIGFARDNLEYVPSGADLNNYVKAGNYYVVSGTVANTLVNAPGIGGNGRLVVMENTTNYGNQIIFNTNWRGFWYRTFYNADGSWVFSDWTNFSGTRSVSLGNSGYIELGGIANGLIFAWARTIGKIVTKPIPFITYVAQPTDSSNGATNDRRAFQWDYSSTTNTTDSFSVNSETDAYTVFWVGKAV